MTIQHVAVIGAGQMGSGIAQVFAGAQYRVIVFDAQQAALEKSEAFISSILDRSIMKERMTESEKTGLMDRLTFTNDFSRINKVDLVIEAIVENEEAKCTLFKQLDEQLPQHTIFASNTSSIPITKLAAVTNRPHQVIGMHFMNPVPVMKLVEVIPGLQTNDETYEQIATVTKQLNKTSVASADFPGFIANRILMPMINEAIYTVYEGVASIEDVDTVMKLGMNHPMGPLTLADFIGLDTCLSIMEVMYEGFGDDKYRPCPLLKQYVQAGWYGKKSGRGFFTYE